MFNSVNGIITAKYSDKIYLEAGPLEWELAMNGLDIAALPALGSELRLFLHLIHRENEMRFYAFPSAERRETFLELIKVAGIGPRGATKIMGGIGQEDLIAALENEDLARLETVPGLGKKTAQKMLLALKGRLVFDSDKKKEEAEELYPDLAAALAEMGYEKKAVTRALGKLVAEKGEALAGLSGHERENILFREAVLLLSQGA